MKINPNKSKALSFTRARVKDPLNYSLGDQKIPEASCCKYSGTSIYRFSRGLRNKTMNAGKRLIRETITHRK